MEDQGVWSKILEELKSRTEPEGVELWFSAVKFLGREDGKIILKVPNHFARGWIEERYGKELRHLVEKYFTQPAEIEYRISPEPIESSPQLFALPEKNAWKEKAVRANLNPRYTFENFVTGPCNQFAYAASKAVADSNPTEQGSKYNPLFIYGGVGLGKTHLLNAIGNRLLQKNQSLRVVCVQAEAFMNELINSIRTDKIAEFRKRFRKKCDVLLMDDIEILCGKERTQEEFFYTFNELYESGRQIVMTSDRVPSELSELTERLRSRFESGMIVDIQPPEYETKLAIIKKKAEENQVQIPDEVCDYLAKNIKSNIRKLEGSLVRICAYASLTGEKITPELAKRLLADILQDSKDVNPEKILKITAQTFGLKVQDLKGEKRMRKYVLARQTAMFLCRKLLNLSFPEIGEIMGGKDHSTVIHSCRKISQLLENNQELRALIEKITNRLGVSLDFS